MAIYKNVASQILAVYAYDSTDASSKIDDQASITAQISKDGAATAATNDTNPTQLDPTDAPGIYLFTMTQAETDADLIILYAKSATSNILLEPLTIYTTPGNSTAIDVNAIQVEGADATDQINAACDTAVADASLATAANLATVDGIVDSILADTAELQTDDIPGTLATMTGKIDVIDGIADNILADTAELQTDDIPGTLTTMTGKIDVIDGIVDTILLDTAELQTDDIPGTLTSMTSKIDVIDGIVDTILVDTNELQVDWTNGGRLDTIIDNILVDTGVIGAAGAGLTAIPWNAAWDAEVQSEANDAMVALGLDHLVSASVAGGDITDNSIVAKLVSKESTADWDDFVNTTDSLQAIRDNQGGGGGTATEDNQNLIVELLSAEAKF